MPFSIYFGKFLIEFSHLKTRDQGQNKDSGLCVGLISRQRWNVWLQWIQLKTGNHASIHARETIVSGFLWFETRRSSMDQTFRRDPCLVMTEGLPLTILLFNTLYLPEITLSPEIMLAAFIFPCVVKGSYIPTHTHSHTCFLFYITCEWWNSFIFTQQLPIFISFPTFCSRLQNREDISLL